MAILSTAEIGVLLSPYYESPGAELLEKLSVYLELLLKWNERTNLTAVREPERIVTRHFGEALFVARHLPPCASLLDLGSGAGFPGVPIQLVLPGLSVTLGESQNKKAAFLREVIRQLGLSSEVWAQRVEAMPPARRFDVVAWRAVDKADVALAAAETRVAAHGWLASLRQGPGLSGDNIVLPGGAGRTLNLSRT